MRESTEAILTYPEHHAAWLEAMGVMCWQANKPLMTPVKLNTTTKKDNSMCHRSAEPVMEQSVTHTTLTPQIEMADYWVIGVQPLAPDEVYLLAGMMQAIDAKAVVFSHPADELTESVMQTGLASWPRLVVHGMPFAQSIALPKAIKVLFLGDQLFEHQAKSWCLPALTELLTEPMRKRDAWEILKKVKMT